MDRQPPNHVTLGKDGRVTLPRAIREAARLAPGSRLIVTTTVDGTIEIRSADLVRARAWSLSRKHDLDARPLVEDLLAERKTDHDRG